jgi:hypothetical protein
MDEWNYCGDIYNTSGARHERWSIWRIWTFRISEHGNIIVAWTVVWHTELYSRYACQFNLIVYTEIPLTGLTPPYFCACPKSGPELPMSICRALFCVQWVQLRRQVIVRFPFIGGIDEHHCWDFIFIIRIKSVYPILTKHRRQGLMACWFQYVVFCTNIIIKWRGLPSYMG